MADNATNLERSLAIALGDRLRQLRKEAGLTQEEVAERAEMTRNHYQSIEYGGSSTSGTSNPTLKSIYNISRALDTTVVDILEGVFPSK